MHCYTVIPHVSYHKFYSTSLPSTTPPNPHTPGNKQKKNDSPTMSPNTSPKQRQTSFAQGNQPLKTRTTKEKKTNKPFTTNEKHLSPPPNARGRSSPCSPPAAPGLPPSRPRRRPLRAAVRPRTPRGAEGRREGKGGASGIKKIAKKRFL